MMRVTLAVAVACFSLVGVTTGKDAEAAMRMPTNIAAQGLAPALKMLAKERDVQLVYRSELVNEQQTSGAAGDLTFEEALTQLLSGTGLTYHYLENNAITIVPIPSRSSSTLSTSAENSPLRVRGEEPFWDRFRLAQVDQERTNKNSDTSAGYAVELEEVIVTANKRTEKSSDVPMSVSAISGDHLVKTQSTTLQDIANRVPGLQLINSTPTSNDIVIHGISIGGGINSSVATYVDEVPYISAGPFADSPNFSPNFDTFDLARIEVLRGPQGTLYGANALGGLLKYVTNAPDPSGYSASLLTGGSSVDHGGSGYEVHGMVNLPLGDTAALRIVAHDERFPGYIDDTSRGQTNVNDVHRYGARASFLWKPSEDFSVRLGATLQNLTAGDNGSVDLVAATLQPLYGDLVQQRRIAQLQRTRNEIYNGTLNWQLGFADLVSSSSYIKGGLTHEWNDLSFAYAPILNSIFGRDYGAALEVSEPVHSFTQELRLASHQGSKAEWLIGGFFNDEAADERESIWALDPATAQPLYDFEPALGAYHILSTYREYAVFGDLTYHFTSAFELGLGGRYSTNRQSYHQENAGLFTGTNDFVTRTSQNVFTYSVDAKYRFNPRMMVYARVASGFVPGGPNSVIPGSTLPSSFRSSSTTNSELGVKGSAFDGRLNYDADVFDVEWRDIQLFAVINNQGTITNGGTARSRGVEGEITFTPAHGLTLMLNGAYTVARLTEDTPASFGGHTGDRLPLAPYFAGTASAEYERPLWGAVSGFGGLDWHYNGDRMSPFEFGSPRQVLPSYSLVNLRAGLKYRSYLFTAYIKNVGDERAINTVSPETLGGVSALTAAIMVPRTIGVTLSATF